MSFERDLFISYAHIDNQPLTPEQQGWITRFHASLDALLSMRMGGEARIWRDDKLQGNDVFADEIVDQFARTAVLVSVLTPRYLNSEWCTREVAEFCRSAAQSGGLVVENKARVFKVLKTPVDTQEPLPSVMRDVLGYEFFTFEDEAPLELDPAYGEKFAQDYNRKVGKLAWDISELLKKLANGGNGHRDNGHPGNGHPGNDHPDSGHMGNGHREQGPAKPTVYLAECSYDRKETREILEGELKHHGYSVVPHQRLPQDEEHYVAEVERLLARSTLAVHLVGESFGIVPDGPSQKSVVVLQNELAARRSRSGALARVIWLPDGTYSEQAPQQAFIEALHTRAEAQRGADLITGDLEALKASIHGTLKKLEKEQLAKPAVADATQLIYVLCDPKDRKATVPLRKLCKQQGFDVALPVFEGDAAAVRRANQQLLSDCDAVLLFYGAGGEAWKRTVDNELRKMPGYRGGKPLAASYTYLAEPKTTDKEDLIDMEEPHLIDGMEGLPEAEVADFVQALEPAGGAP